MNSITVSIQHVLDGDGMFSKCPLVLGDDGIPSKCSTCW